MNIVAMDPNSSASPYLQTHLQAFRDDGPLNELFSRRAGARIAPLLGAAAAGVLALFMFWAGLDGAAIALLVAVLAVAVLGVSAGHPHNGRIDWLVPPVVRTIEYGYVAVLGFAHGAPAPLIYALIAVLAYHHYDTVYRTRQGLLPPRWVSRAGFGWDGRLLILAVAGLLGALPFAYAGLAAYLGVLFGVESVLPWISPGRGNSVLDDPE